MTTAELTTKTTPAETILKRSVCLVLHCGYLGNHRKVNLRGLDVSKDGVELDREKDELGASKRLFAVADLRSCEKSIAAVKDRLRAMSLDGGTRLFGDGAYMLPLLSVVEAEQVIADGQAQLAKSVEALVAQLPEIIARRAQKLGNMFNAAEYPTADDIRGAYRIDYNFVSFGAPERLVDVDVAVAERAKADWNAKLSTAYDDVVLGLRTSALTVMRELANRLKPAADGKPKALQPTALRDIQELLEQLPILNSVAGDEPLVGLLAPVGAVASGIDVDVLRKAPGVRAMLLAQAEAAVAALDELVTADRRAISFGPIG